MENITKGQIKVTGAIEFDHILDFEMEQTANEHARAIITGNVIKDNYTRALSNMADQAVYVKAKNHILFCGYVVKTECIALEKYATVQMELMSSSILLDQKYRMRSFQNTNLTIRDVMDMVAGTDGQGDVLYNGSKVKLKMPLIQYQETDWEFLRRLTSRVGSVIYPDIRSERPILYVGISGESSDITFPETEYSFGFSDRYYERSRTNQEKYSADFVYYELNTYKSINFGCRVKFQHKDYHICYKKARLMDGELVFTYQLGKEGLISLEPYDNELFAGMTITGRVLSSKNETIKIHLDIDDRQAESEAYDYEWVPQTGNIMYCMPKPGTKVGLYFKDSSEESAIAVSCIRENSDTCPQMGNVNDRYLTAENKKQLYLKPDCMGFDTGESGMKLTIADKNAISMESKKELNLLASKKVQLKAKKIVVSTPSELMMSIK